ncbi:MAG: MoxR family ATPase [Planctomycetota bacterium]|nr:MAG: MoxR family ATPase [Planctomycetota bacterium]
MSSSFLETLERFKKRQEQILGEVKKVIVGQEEVLEQVFAAIFSRGHCLLVGVPGLAKTLLVNTIAKTMALSFKRIQFTPDLMPSDITGTNVIEEQNGKREYRFVEGPLFAHIILADEINRTPPKTQAALLECMQERQVTVGKTTYPLPKPFFVIATQNPIEQEGTYPLPEAQQDRFMFSIHVDYPNREEEEKILETTTGEHHYKVRPLIRGEEVLELQKVIGRVPVAKHIIRYAASLVRATRPKSSEAPDFVKEFVEWGAGPRAGQYLIFAAKAFAAMDGRINVSISDIKKAAVPVLRHRIAVNFQAQAEGLGTVEIIQKLLTSLEEPEVERYG